MKTCKNIDKACFVVSIINYTKINIVTQNISQVYLKDLFFSSKVTIKR